MKIGLPLIICSDDFCLPVLILYGQFCRKDKILAIIDKLAKERQEVA